VIQIEKFAKRLAENDFEFLDHHTSVPIEKFARAGGMPVSEFLDHHTRVPVLI